MKASTLIKTFAASVIVAVSGVFTSCSSMSEPNTGIPIKMQASVYTRSLDLPSDVCTAGSPIRVVGYAREKKCSAFYYLFEDNAYIDGNGQLKWVGTHHYWPGEYMKFVAYWPASASVTLDAEGNVISADCILLGISEPYCHLSENPSITLTPYDSTTRTDNTVPSGTDPSITDWNVHSSDITF